MRRIDLTPILLILGSTIGAGIFALPKAAAINGLPSLLFDLAVASTFCIGIDFILSEASERTRKRTVTGIVEYSLGRAAASLLFTMLFMSGVGTLAAYIIGCSDVLHEFLGMNIGLWKVILVAVLGYIVAKGLPGVSKAQKVLAPLIIVFCFSISIYLVLSEEFSVSNLREVSTFKPLSCFGICLFALSSAIVMPEIASAYRKEIYKDILIAYGIILLLYVLFPFSFVGVYGRDIRDVSVLGMSGFLKIAGGILILVCMLTSYIGIGMAVVDCSRRYLGDFSPLVVSAVVLLISSTNVGFFRLLDIIGSIFFLFINIIVIAASIKICCKRVNKILTRIMLPFYIIYAAKVII